VTNKQSSTTLSP